MSNFVYLSFVRTRTPSSIPAVTRCLLPQLLTPGNKAASGRCQQGLWYTNLSTRQARQARYSTPQAAALTQCYCQQQLELSHKQLQSPGPVQKCHAARLSRCTLIKPQLYQRQSEIFNRPGVAGAILQSPPCLIDSLIN